MRLVLLTLLSVSMLGAAGQPPTLAIGATAPDFNLPGIDGKDHSLNEYSKAKALVILFTCNHCPTAQLYERRIKALVDDYRGKGVTFVAIEPNDPDAVRLDEMGYTDVNDGMEDMKIRAKYRGFAFPYLYDGATQTVSTEYGPKATPHAFVFDGDRKLVFEGRIDDNQRVALAKTHETRDAIDAVLAGKAVAVPHTPVFGCSVKWKEKISGRETERKRIEAMPVKVELVNEAGLKALRKNSTGKLMLVNFWATWCGPCLTEMPDLLETWHMYKNRDFALVTVAVNAPDEKEGVVRALTRMHSGTRNLLFDSADVYKMQAAFDPTWEAGVPYSALIDKNGKVLYQKQGTVDILELRRLILAHLPDDDYKGHRDYWAESIAGKR